MEFLCPISGDVMSLKDDRRHASRLFFTYYKSPTTSLQSLRSDIYRYKTTSNTNRTTIAPSLASNTTPTMPPRIPRALSLRLRPLLQHHHRTIATTRPALSAWSPSPSPPRLPKEEQDLFERLQNQSSGAFSTPRAADSATDMSPPTGNATAVSDAHQQRPQVNQSPGTDRSPGQDTVSARVDAGGKGEELHPNIRRGAPPEFEGEINPKTGEVGGPKNEPLRWGDSGDWSYNGRVTDF